MLLLHSITKYYKYYLPTFPMTRKVLLDTNFILTCIAQKIDFFEEFYLSGIKVIIPENVISELEKLKKTAALKLLEKNEFKKISLQGKNVDNSIVKFARENPEIIIATLDKEMRKKIKNKKVTIRSKKIIEII